MFYVNNYGGHEQIQIVYFTRVFVHEGGGILLKYYVLENINKSDWFLDSLVSAIGMDGMIFDRVTEFLYFPVFTIKLEHFKIILGIVFEICIHQQLSILFFNIWITSKAWCIYSEDCILDNGGNEYKKKYI